MDEPEGCVTSAGGQKGHVEHISSQGGDSSVGEEETLDQDHRGEHDDGRSGAEKHGDQGATHEVTGGTHP